MSIIDAAAASNPDTVLWEAPAFGRASPLAVADLEEIERAAREEGFTRGHADGYAQGQADLRRVVARMEGIADAFSRPLAGLDNEIEHALAALATQIAGALVRDTYATDPQKMVALVREAIASAGTVARSTEVRVHPEDLAMLRPLMNDISTFVPDISLARGDVRVHTENVRIDARLATRLKSILDNLHAEPAL
jgi:flagellar assembly protein FliH